MTAIPEPAPSGPSPGRSVVLTLAACAVTTGLATPLRTWLDPANIVMLFLLTVLVVAVRLGRNAAILASVLSVLCFDLFFVPPRFSLAVSNLQYLVTFAVMLATALTTTHFTASLSRRASEAVRREQRTQALYQLATQLAGALTREQVGEITAGFIRTQLQGRARLIFPSGTSGEAVPVTTPDDLPVHPDPVRHALEHGEIVRDLATLPPEPALLYLPLRTAMQTRGVLAVQLPPKQEAAGDGLALLEALASLVAVAVERLHYVEVAHATEVDMLTERLRGSILSALSHDLRTPLTALVGLADSLSLIRPALPDAALETAQALREQADRMAGLMGNLLEMARLNSGRVTLRREWQPLEEVVGAGIKLLGPALAAHPVRVALDPALPLLAFDAVLIERVLGNLLENAAKYAPPHTAIEVRAVLQGDMAEISVADRGPGFPVGTGEDLFGMFVRGQTVSGKPGAGLGLAICKTIVEAHGGAIAADNRPDGGGVVRFTLPVGQPPVIEEETA